MTEQAQKPEVRFHWGAIGVGFLAAYAVAMVAALVAGLFGQSASPLAQPAAGIVASLIGGIVAGRRAPSSGAFNGCAAAGAYIFFLSILKGIDEIAIVETWGWYALPKMDMTGLIVWDLLYLSAGAIGGRVARRG